VVGLDVREAAVVTGDRLDAGERERGEWRTAAGALVWHGLSLVRSTAEGKNTRVHDAERSVPLPECDGADEPARGNYHYGSRKRLNMSGSNEEADADALVAYYRRYIGDPDRAVDVYAGFGLFFVGLALGLVGVAVFLYSATLPANSPSMYAVREVAVVAAAIGLPALLLGVVVLLPIDERMLYLGGVGGAVCVVAAGLFVWAYPHAWNVTNPPDYSAQGVAVYSLGLVLVIGSTGAALVAHRVERATGSAAPGGAVDAGSAAEGAGSDAADDDRETVTDEQVRADIERELNDAELTWGGVERTETRRLELNTSAIDDVEVDREKLAGSATETRSTSGNVDDAISQLKGLQGGETNTASGQGTDDQAAALRELRERQQAEDLAEAEEEESIVDRVKRLF